MLTLYFIEMPQKMIASKYYVKGSNITNEKY